MEKQYSRYFSINRVLDELPDFYDEEDIPVIVETLESFLDKYDPEDRAMGRVGIIRDNEIVMAYSCLFYLLSTYYNPKPDTTINKVYDYFHTYMNNNNTEIECDKLMDRAMELFGERTNIPFKWQ